MLRKKLVAGNWKMHKTALEAETTVAQVANALGNKVSCDVWIAPPAVYLQTLIQKFTNSSIRFGAQNAAAKTAGAYTGEISALMLQSIGCGFVILGHSERRQYFYETDAIIYEKITQALQHKLTTVYCCGETLENRNAGKHFTVIQQQVETALFSLSTADMQQVIIAYEPVWAIGTGINASPEQAQEMHAFIRKLLSKHYGETVSENTRILYGGSVKPSNAAALFAQKDIDGGLIGGASLDADEFIHIIHAAEN